MGLALLVRLVLALVLVSRLCGGAAVMQRHARHLRERCMFGMFQKGATRTLHLSGFQRFGCLGANTQKKDRVSAVLVLAD